MDETVDAVIDAGTDRLHEVVLAKLGEPVVADLVEEAAGEDRVSELTRQQIELAIIAAARRDEVFAAAVTQLLGQIRSAEQGSGTQIVAGSESTIFTGDATATSYGCGTAVGQAGTVNIGDPRPKPDPQRPDPARH